MRFHTSPLALPLMSSMLSGRRSRIDATIPTLTPEERKRLAEYMRKSDPNFIVVLETLEKEGH